MSNDVTPADHTGDARPAWPGRRAGAALQSLVFLLPFAIFAVWVYRYAANAPLWDDFDAILAFLNAFLQAGSPYGRLETLFWQHMEHRIVLVRVAALVQYSMRGQVSFRELTFFGSTGWLLATLVLSIYLKRRYHWPLSYVLPVPFVMLSFMTHLNMFWAMGSIQNYWVVLFSVLCLICLAERKILYATCLFPLALFTSGAGAALYPLGCLYLLLQRKFKPLLLFAIPSTAFIALFFWHYWRIDIGGSPGGAKDAALWLLAFLGNAAGYAPLAIIAGLIGLAGLLLILVRSSGDDFLRLMAAFTLIVAVTTTSSRGGLGLAHAMSRHYAMYSLLTVVCLYAFVLTTIRNSLAPRAARLAQIAAVLFFAVVFVRYDHTQYFEQVRAQRLNSILAFSKGDATALLIPNTIKGAAILSESERLGLYNTQTGAH